MAFVVLLLCFILTVNLGGDSLRECLAQGHAVSSLASQNLHLDLIHCATQCSHTEFSVELTKLLFILWRKTYSNVRVLLDQTSGSSCPTSFFI